MCKLNAHSNNKLRTIREGVMKITSAGIVALDTTQRRLEEAGDAVEEADGAELDRSPVLLLPSSSKFSRASSSGASPWSDSLEWLVSENEDDAAVAPDSVGTYPLLAQDWLALEPLVPVKDDAAEVSVDLETSLGWLNLYLNPSLRMTFPRSARRCSAVTFVSSLWPFNAFCIWICGQEIELDGSIRTWVYSESDLEEYPSGILAIEGYNTLVGRLYAYRLLLRPLFRAKEDVTSQQSRNWTTTVTITRSLQRGKQPENRTPRRLSFVPAPPPWPPIQDQKNPFIILISSQNHGYDAHLTAFMPGTNKLWRRTTRQSKSGHGGPEHFARLAVEGLATVPLLQVALQLAHAGAVHVLVLQRMLHIFQKREVGWLRGTSFSRRSPTSGSSLLDGAS